MKTTKLNLTLIDALEADIRLGLSDTQLWAKYHIARSTWFRWKRIAEEDRLNDTQSAYTLLVDILRDERRGLTNPGLVNYRYAGLSLSLIYDLEVDSRCGLNDKQLRQKYQIAESTWYHWKRIAEEDD